MLYRDLGKTGMNASIIGFGCNQLGSHRNGYKVFEDARAAIYKALDEGINYFDTADVYGDKKSEEWLGNILESERNRVIISTKAGLTGDGGRNGSPVHLRDSLEESLKKLKTDYIDIFYLHRPDPKIPLAESLGGISQFISEGKVRFGGVSQLDISDLESIKDDGVISCVQYCLNIFNFQTAYSVMPIAKKRGYGFTTYSPFASGWIFKEKYIKLVKKRFPFFYKRYYRPEFPEYKAVFELAGNYQTNLYQLIICWIFGHKDVHSAIFGSSSCDQLSKNIIALDVDVSSELIQDVESLILDSLHNRRFLRTAVWGVGLRGKELLAECVNVIQRYS